MFASPGSRERRSTGNFTRLCQWSALYLPRRSWRRFYFGALVNLGLSCYRVHREAGVDFVFFQRGLLGVQNDDVWSGDVEQVRVPCHLWRWFATDIVFSSFAPSDPFDWSSGFFIWWCSVCSRGLWNSYSLGSHGIKFSIELKLPSLGLKLIRTLTEISPRDTSSFREVQWEKCFIFHRTFGRKITPCPYWRLQTKVFSNKYKETNSKRPRQRITKALQNKGSKPENNRK